MGGANWIQLADVSFVRSRRVILDRIDWTIRPGEHWVVLGANGSGKTTLLQILAGYLWPSTGQVTVLGERFGETDLRELRKRIGWVGSFLQAQVPPRQSPLDFIVSGKFASLGIFETPQEEDYRQARHLALYLGVDKVLNSPYGILSQGEKQRLLIARALIHHPQLLILDEPCAGLDLVAREQLLGVLETLAGEASAPNLIFVTHHLEEIMPVFTHAFLLKEGMCLARGRKDDVLESGLLSQAFGVSLELYRSNGRYWAQVTSPSLM